MSRKDENKGFICANCGGAVGALTNGSYRNHCPFCLHSLHVDILPGDRASGCGGLMEPIGLRMSGRKGYQIIHRCRDCGAQKANRIACGTQMPDDWDIIIKLPVK